MTIGSAPAVVPRCRTRWLPAGALLVASPVCAEYVAAYDDSTGRPLALLGGLLFFVPLYGAPALLIREMARRTGMRWPGILALAAGAMIFVGGHAIQSFGIPIALVEAASPAQSRTPWLRWPGLVVTTVLYLAAAALILSDHLTTESDHASAGQVGGALGVAVLLMVFAGTVGRRRPTRREGRVPRPLLVGALSLAAALGFHLMPPTWPGVAGGLTILAVVATAVTRLSRSSRWDGRHVAWFGTGALAASAVLAFFAEPLGDVPAARQLAHNAVMLLGAVGLGLFAARRAEPASR